MNANGIRFTILALVIYLNGCSVQAQQNNGNLPPPPANNAQPSGWQPGYGHHGNLTPEQRAQRRQKLLQRFDTNGNGVLDPDEKAAMHQFMQERRARRFGQAGFGQGSGGQVQRFGQGPGVGTGQGRWQGPGSTGAPNSQPNQ